MGLLDPTAPPYDPLEWAKKPLAERGRMVCEAWAMQGYGTPAGRLRRLRAEGRALRRRAGSSSAASARRSAGSPRSRSWWLHPVAFQKAIVWSMLFEVLGLGCGSGPLTGRYFPPVGGFLYFLRRGTTKLPSFPGLPVLGGRTRGALDVLLYLALLVASRARAPRARARLRALPAARRPRPARSASLDKTIFLAARGEHYWVTIVCFAFAGQLDRGRQGRAARALVLGRASRS